MVIYSFKINNSSAPIKVMGFLVSLLEKDGIKVYKFHFKSCFTFQRKVIITTGIFQDLLGYILKLCFNYEWISLIQCIPTRDLKLKGKYFALSLWLYLLRRSDRNFSLSKSHARALNFLGLSSIPIYLNGQVPKDGMKYRYIAGLKKTLVFMGGNNSIKRPEYLYNIPQEYNVLIYGFKNPGFEVPNNVKFMGWSNNPWKNLPENSIIVNPSLTEANPLIMNEALFFGFPYVASCILPYQEFRKVKNVHLFRKHSIGDLLKVIDSVESNQINFEYQSDMDVNPLLNYLKNDTHCWK